MASQTLPVVTGDKDRSLQEVLSRLTSSPGARSAGQADPIVTAAHRLPAIAASFAPFPEETDDRLRGALAVAGHRAALHPSGRSVSSTCWRGRNVVIITPTASGKTLCYNAPVLDAILKDPSTRALYLFPTKALAQDQLAELHALSEARHATAPSEIGVFTYDGDTPQDARRAIRGKAHVVLSNPDMLHSGILPHHPRWAKLFENLRFVVIDELHAYRGVFGSHLANILRRLRRVCRHYGSDPVVHLFVGDDRQPARAGRRPDRFARSSSSTRTARRAARSSSSSSIRRSSMRSWASAARIWRRRAASRSSS